MKIQNVPPPAPQPQRVWTSLDLINWTKDFFAKKGIESPRLEAELLLSEVLGVPRIKLYVDFEKAVPQEQLAKFREFVKRRADTRAPLQYILGWSQFIDLKLKVTPAVLIPRPETETLAVWAVTKLKDAAGESLRVLDLCTGSGCLALYIASKEPRATVVATDISPDALAIAAENAKALLPNAERVEFKQGDLFAAVPTEARGTFDMIVANPPYIDPATKATLQPEVRDHEPALALFAEENGLAVTRRIVTAAAEWLKSGAWLAVELGAGQSEAAKKIAEECGGFSSIEILVDNHRLPRFMICRK
jgi:release factor glutamine methyltransferase